MVNILQSVVRKHLGDEIPSVYEISKNVSFILQNSHFSVSYPRAFMPNVAEIACIHCKPAQTLPNVSKAEPYYIFMSIIHFNSSGLGRFHCGRWWFRIHLCEYGIICESSEYAGKFTKIAGKHFCEAAIPCAVEVRIVNHTKRFATERENFSMASAARHFGTQKTASLHHTRGFVEHVRNRLSWGSGCCDASFLRSRLQLGKS